MTNFGIARTRMNVDGGTSVKMCMEPNFSNLSSKNDTAVRHWARKLTLKHLELLKACKVVMERYDKIPEINPKVTNWNENFDRKFSIWKIAHGRFLNLKESCRLNLPKEWPEGFLFGQGFGKTR